MSNRIIIEWSRKERTRHREMIRRRDNQSEEETLQVQSLKQDRFSRFVTYHKYQEHLNHYMHIIFWNNVI